MGTVTHLNSNHAKLLVASREAQTVIETKEMVLVSASFAARNNNSLYQESRPKIQLAAIPSGVLLLPSLGIGTLGFYLPQPPSLPWLKR